MKILSALALILVTGLQVSSAQKAVPKTQKPELDRACLAVDAFWAVVEKTGGEMRGMSDDSLETLDHNASRCSDLLSPASVSSRKTYTAKHVALLHHSDFAGELVAWEQLRRLRQSIKTVPEIPDSCKFTMNFGAKTPEAQTPILNKATLKELSSYEEGAWNCLSALMPASQTANFYVEENYDGRVVEYIWNSFVLREAVYLERLRRSGSDVQFWSQGYWQLNAWVDTHLRDDDRLQASFDALLAEERHAGRDLAFAARIEATLNSVTDAYQDREALEEMRKMRRAQQDAAWELFMLNQNLRKPPFR